MPNSKKQTNMALYPRQNSRFIRRHLIMRRNHKNHIGSPCKSVFDFLSLALLLAHTPYYYTADSLLKLNYSPVKIIDLKLGMLKLEC